jgi:hypothetical protein
MGSQKGIKLVFSELKSISTLFFNIFWNLESSENQIPK